MINRLNPNKPSVSSASDEQTSVARPSTAAASFQNRNVRVANQQQSASFLPSNQVQQHAPMRSAAQKTGAIKKHTITQGAPKFPVSAMAPPQERLAATTQTVPPRHGYDEVPTGSEPEIYSYVDTSIKRDVHPHLRPKTDSPPRAEQSIYDTTQPGYRSQDIGPVNREPYESFPPSSAKRTPNQPARQDGYDTTQPGYRSQDIGPVNREPYERIQSPPSSDMQHTTNVSYESHELRYPSRSHIQQQTKPSGGEQQRISDVSSHYSRLDLGSRTQSDSASHATGGAASTDYKETVISSPKPRMPTPPPPPVPPRTYKDSSASATSPPSVPPRPKQVSSVTTKLDKDS